jgi:hypothetical protein
MRLEITDDDLIVHLSLGERLASLNGSIRLPLAHVRGATDDDGIRRDMGLRYRGCRIPGLFAAGTFWRGGDHQFIFAGARQRLVVIELAGEKWARIVLGVRDARATASRINAAAAPAVRR